MRTKRTAFSWAMTVLTLVSVTIASLMVPPPSQTALAVGGDSTINFAAADPTYYIPPIPYPVTVSPIAGQRGRETAIPSAWFKAPGGSDVRVESLMPENMALGQIVPFEIKITVNGSTEPEGGTITFVAGWSTVTSNSGDFGYAESYGVYAASLTRVMAPLIRVLTRQSAYSHGRFGDEIRVRLPSPAWMIRRCCG